MSHHLLSPRSTESLLRYYCHAKDENRPLYIAWAFAADAALSISLRTQANAFPPESHGVEAITDTLVRKFGQTYENIFTFCLSRPAANVILAEYACDWIIVMTEKASGNVNVGCGHYDWVFQAEPHRIKKLTITIEAKVSLPSDTAATIFGWLLALDYPWTNTQHVGASAPPLESLAPVVHYLLHPGE